MKSYGYEIIDQCEGRLNDLARYLHDNPELAYKEYKSHDYLTSFLEEFGFKVERNFLIETAFRAVFQTAEKPHFVIMVEYDALPEIGHACGHNIIAQSSIATALGLKAVMSRENLSCKLSVLGTPAEEGGGGKLKFIEAGVLVDVDLAIMSHPFSCDMGYLPFLAISRILITFKGKEAHASVTPWKGINALDAAVLAYQSISCLRQQMHPDCRVHGVFTKGGDVPNIIPGVAELDYMVRAPSSQLVAQLITKIRACCQGTALATGCQVEITDHMPPYADIVPNDQFLRVFLKNSHSIPQTDAEKRLLKSCSFEKNEEHRDLTGSSDAGNISYVTPTIHPMFHVGTDAQVHTAQFAECTGTKTAFKYGIRQSKIMLGTLIDIVNDDNLLESIKHEFEERIKKIESTS